MPDIKIKNRQGEPIQYDDKENNMIYTLNSPLKMGIYHNSKKKSLAQIKQELESQYNGRVMLCNLNLFNLAAFTGDCFTKADGKVVGSDGYIYNVLAWNIDDKKMVQTTSNKVGSYGYAFGCLEILKDGKYCVTTLPTWATGARQRTAIGIKADGTPVIYCSQSSVAVQNVALALSNQGCVYAINVDGGLSTQCDTPNGVLTSSRIVHTLFWALIEQETSTKPAAAPITTTKCPYTEPIFNVKKGSTGNGAKWTQWHLKMLGYDIGTFGSNGDGIDGDFGSKSVEALKQFQKDVGFSVEEQDGICGINTRRALKTALSNLTQQTTTAPIKKVKITASVLNIRSGAGTSYAIVGTLNNGAEVEVFDEKNGWYKTEKGWISKTYACDIKTIESVEKPNDKQGKINKMLDFAYAQIGSPYIYGAQGEVCTNSLVDWSARLFPSYTTPTRANRVKKYILDHPNIKAFDCSGFVLEALKAAGIEYPDTTAAGIYYTYCTPIAQSELREGDLVFTNGLDHIGMVGRNGEIVAAEGSDIGVVKTANVTNRICQSIYYPNYNSVQYYSKSQWTKFGRLKCFEE